jgi:hypothetical protein
MLPAWEILSSPFWKLLLLFQPLVLQPQQSSAKLNQKMCSRLKLFTSGHIKNLYSEMMSQPSSKLQCNITVNDLDECELLYSQLLDADDSPKFNPGAQAAADLGNLHSAFQRLHGSHPVTINTDKAMEYMKNELFLDPPTNDLFPLPGQTDMPTWIPSKPLT